MAGRIAKQRVDRLQTGRVPWDCEPKGFGVRRRDQDAKYYVLKFRTRAGRQRWCTIGRPHPPIR